MKALSGVVLSLAMVLCPLFLIGLHAAETGVKAVVFEAGTDQVVVHKLIDAPRPMRHENSDRDVAYFPEKPLFSIDIQRPIKDLVIRVQSSQKGFSYLVRRKDGAAWNNGQHRKQGCWPLTDEPKPFAMSPQMAKRIALAAGVYEVFVGYPKEQAYAPATILIHEKRAEFGPFSVSFPIPASDRVLDRVANDYYPLVEPNPTREQAQELMIHAGPSLWVYTTVDLDGDSAEAKPNDLPYLEALAVGKRVAQAAASQEIAYPKKNEPGVLVRSRTGRLLFHAADGASFLVSTNDLTAKRPAAIAWPTTLRNQNLNLNAVIANASQAEKKRAAAFLARRQKAEHCWRSFVGAKGGFTARNVSIYEVTSVGGKIVSVANYKEKVALQADQKCNIPKIKSEEERLLKDLRASYVTRGLARIEQMKAALKP